MPTLKRPFLVLPKFIEQPTWGGNNYIVKIKNMTKNTILKDKKIGQSYELFGNSKLLVNITDSENQSIIPELGTANSTKITNLLPYQKGRDYIAVSNVTKLHKKIMLIKITQALGNSFQLHIKPSSKDKRWKSKPESWYYLEDGLLTFGVNKNAKIENYKQTCLLIEKRGGLLSKQVKDKTISIETARSKIKSFIKKTNPWQYVNSHQVKKGALIDLGSGGIQHSWEEDKEKYPLGNVLYEIQKDVMDPVSTIRAFDQGKIANNGTIRKIHIQDYFQHLDVNPDHNDIAFSTLKEKNGQLLSSQYYCLEKLSLKKPCVYLTNNSFVHLFVISGKVTVSAKGGSVVVSKGYSCFVPEFVEKYIITPLSRNTVILKAFVKS